MPCKFCSNEKEFIDFVNKFPDTQYCPVCGCTRAMVEFFLAVKHINFEPMETVVIDGKTLIYEREPIKMEIEKPSVTRIDLTHDPDKVDISKELEMLKKYNDKQRKDREMLGNVLRERVEETMRKKRIRDFINDLIFGDFDI
jgi:hypothetical protein